MADAKKLVVMILSVDLQCDPCYKKVKKVLCKFPQIRDQIYDEKQNTVTIKVVCCNPEKLRDKIFCKGCGVITCIVIEKPEPKPEPKPPQPEPCPIHICVPVLINPPGYPIGVCCRQCCEGRGGGPCYSGCGRPGPCCDGCASGRPSCDSCGGGRPCYVSHHCEYLNEENASGCTVM